MYFRNLVVSAFFLAMTAGTVLSAYQVFFITPLILEAEVYEVAQPIIHTQTNTFKAWTPEKGVERHGWNFTSNFLVSFSFALMILSAMSINTSVTVLAGFFWGGAAYLTVFAAPALGLPPELPSIEAAYLEGRQIWWFLTVFVTAVSLWLIVYKTMIRKLIGLVLIMSPHIIGAPQPEIHGFINNSPQAIEVLTGLWYQFILHTSIVNLLLWLVMGTGAGFLVNKYIQPLEDKS